MDKKKIVKQLKYSLRFLPDALYLKLYYYYNFHQFPDIDHPKKLSEKIQWMKLNIRDPYYTCIADKIAVREYVERKIGKEYLIPLVGIWDDPEQINFDKLPSRFVLKCNHDSGSTVICLDKSNCSEEKIKKELKDAMKCQFYYIGREWQYRNIRRKVMCESFLGSSDRIPTDYKIYCFHGKADSILCCYERETGNPKYYVFDLDWNLIRRNKNGLSAPADFTCPKPVCLDQMIAVAEKLSEPFLFARIDLYEDTGHVYFGEITLSPNSGFDKSIIPEADLNLGSKLKLPTVDEYNLGSFDKMTWHVANDT